MFLFPFCLKCSRCSHVFSIVFLTSMCRTISVLLQVSSSFVRKLFSIENRKQTNKTSLIWIDYKDSTQVFPVWHVSVFKEAFMKRKLVRNKLKWNRNWDKNGVSCHSSKWGVPTCMKSSTRNAFFSTEFKYRFLTLVGNTQLPSSRENTH